MRHDNRSHKERARKERSCLLRQAVIQDVMFISFRAWPPANTQPHSREIHERSKTTPSSFRSLWSFKEAQSKCKRIFNKRTMNSIQILF